MKLKTLPIFFVFLCMGFGDAASAFVGGAKAQFALSDFEAFLLDFMAFTLPFGFLSIPMGIVQDKIGKRATLLLGLSVAFVGVSIIPIVGLSSYAVLLLSIFLLGSGAAIMQVSGNPIMRDVSEEGKYSSNLSLAQFVKVIGSITAPGIIGLTAMWGYTEKESWPIIFPIFAVAILISIVSVYFLKAGRETSNESTSASIRSCFGLLLNPYALMMVLGIFLYVGAEKCISSGFALYFQKDFAADFTSAMAANLVNYFFISLMLGRFLGFVILRFVDAKKFFIASTICSLLGFALLATGSQTLAYVALILISLGFANIFPLVFSIAIDRMPQKGSELSGLMVTAIAGGGVVPLFMGKVSDHYGCLLGFIIPALCVVYLLVVALILTRSPKQA